MADVYKNMKEKFDKKNQRLLELHVQTGKMLEPLTDTIKNVKAIPQDDPLFRAAPNKLWNGKEMTGSYETFQEKMNEKFKDYHDSLVAKYLNLDYQKNILKNDKQMETYERLAGYKWFEDGLKDNIEAMMNIKIKTIYETSKTKGELTKKLSDLWKGLEDDYERISKGDGIIDLKDLMEIRQNNAGYADFLRLIKDPDADPEQIARSIEGMEIFDRDEWLKRAEITTKQLINDIEKNGAQEKFIDFVKNITKAKEDLNYEDAKEKFKKKIEQTAQAGVKESVIILKQFNNEIYGDHMVILSLEHISPPAIRQLVHRERERLLNIITVPQSQTDKAVVDFMRGSLETRTAILKNDIMRASLFKTIKDIQTHYPLARRKYGRIPNKIEKLRAWKDPRKEPTPHTRIARLMAMETLAKEADWAIKSLDKTKDFKGLENELDDTQPSDRKIIEAGIDTSYQSNPRLIDMTYISAAERGGFNTRNLALTAIQVWAGVILAANVLNSKKNLPELLSNPYAIAALGTLYGVKKIKQRPEAIKYLLGDPGEKEKIATKFRMDAMAKRFGFPRTENFINNPNEFTIMKKIMEKGRGGANQVKNLLKRLKKRDGLHPLMKKDDLKGLLDEQTWNQLPEDKTGDPRARFWFYERFMTQIRNIDEIQNYTKIWKNETKTI